jgi:hypothetical protein
MEKRVETADGRTIYIRVEDHVVDAGDAPPIAGDIDPEEGATEAMVLVNPAPNTMTVEGAIAGIGKVMRHKFGPAQSPQPGHWWHDWGKYLLGGAVVTGLFAAKSVGLI